MMKTAMRYLLKFWLVLAFASGSAAFAQTQAKVEHTLGAGDVIRVNVFQNPDLGLETRISELGTITFPLVGSVNIGGLSINRHHQTGTLLFGVITNRRI